MVLVLTSSPLRLPLAHQPLLRCIILTAAYSAAPTEGVARRDPRAA
jgi:hypothetical protein